MSFTVPYHDVQNSALSSSRITSSKKAESPLRRVVADSRVHLVTPGPPASLHVQNVARIAVQSLWTRKRRVLAAFRTVRWRKFPLRTGIHIYRGRIDFRLGIQKNSIRQVQRARGNLVWRAFCCAGGAGLAPSLLSGGNCATATSMPAISAAAVCNVFIIAISFLLS